MKKEKNYLDPESDNSRINKVINKSFVPSNRNTPKNYELFNGVSKTGDSIYPATQIEELEQEGGGQVHISLSEIRKILNEELDKRFGSSILFEGGRPRNI